VSQKLNLDAGLKGGQNTNRLHHRSRCLDHGTALVFFSFLAEQDGDRIPPKCCGLYGIITQKEKKTTTTTFCVAYSSTH
jgi:hypothetical protein